MRVCLAEALTIEAAPAFIAQRLVLPDARIPDARQLRPARDDAVAVTAKRAVECGEAELLGRCELEPRADQVSANHRLEQVAALSGTVPVSRMFISIAPLPS